MWSLHEVYSVYYSLEFVSGFEKEVAHCIAQTGHELLLGEGLPLLSLGGWDCSQAPAYSALFSILLKKGRGKETSKAFLFSIITSVETIE